MISAFTLVKISPPKNVVVYKRMKRLAMVRDVTLVYGEYDLVVKTRTDSLEELNAFIYDVLRRIPHITMTTTMIVAKEPPKRKKYQNAT
ncbi:MAG: Lrp/AsnC ligand binding domain-containing protein [Candidatus Bathyarchaeota archaeon]|nr:MAG: Lrp/AsnC ligand binding domain-containing protein [Candidatus Bathyarchaeota archaeon]